MNAAAGLSPCVTPVHPALTRGMGPQDTDEDTGDTDGSSQVAEPWANICLHGAEGGCDAFSD